MVPDCDPHEGTASQMKWCAYFLILVTLWDQVDDVLAIAFVLPSVPVADEDDDYLPAQRRSHEEESVVHKGPAFVRLKPRTADVPPVRSSVPFGWSLTTPFTSSPLYAFMSLQI